MANSIRKLKSKTNSQIAIEWNQLAKIRLLHLTKGADLSYEYVLKPNMLKLCESVGINSTCLDVGCGVGVFTSELAQIFQNIIGIDISSESIKLAVQKNNITYVNMSLDHFSSSGIKFPVIVANMTLMNIIDIESAMKSIGELLPYNGYFIFSITHPYFWPKYYGLDKKKWFKYNEEIIFESNFKITLDKNIAIKSTQIHRPLERYINLLSKNQLCVIEIIEPYPNTADSAKYPIEWKYPRFLLIKCKKMKFTV